MKRLTCEIEIDDEKNVSVKITPLKVEKLWDAYFVNYLNENLETAIADLVDQMINEEIKAAASVSKKREQLLRQIRNGTEKRVRTRVVKSSDLVLPLELRKNKHFLDFDFESAGEKYLENKRKIVFEFMKKFDEAYKKIKSRKKPTTRSNIAEQMYAGDNRLQALRRDLKKIGFTFEEILSVIPE